MTGKWYELLSTFSGTGAANEKRKQAIGDENDNYILFKVNTKKSSAKYGGVNFEIYSFFG